MRMLPQGTDATGHIACSGGDEKHLIRYLDFLLFLYDIRNSRYPYYVHLRLISLPMSTEASTIYRSNLLFAICIQSEESYLKLCVN